MQCVWVQQLVGSYYFSCHKTWERDRGREREGKNKGEREGGRERNIMGGRNIKNRVAVVWVWSQVYKSFPSCKKSGSRQSCTLEISIYFIAFWKSDYITLYCVIIYINMCLS